jgi:anti-anti-sigma regulatory factor
MLRFEGQIVGPWVEEMRRACERHLQPGTSLILDFAEVSFLDRNGIETLRNLRRDSLQIINCSPFVRAQLKEIRA